MFLTHREFHQLQQIITELQPERFEILEESNGIGSVIHIKIPYNIETRPCSLLFEIADVENW